MQYIDPKDKATRRTLDSVTLWGVRQAWRKRGHFRQESTSVRDKQEDGAGPGCNLESELNHGQGIETRSCSLAAVGTGLPVSLPRMCLGSSRAWRSKRAWWEIKRQK